MHFYKRWSIIQRLLFCLGAFGVLGFLFFLEGLMDTGGRWVLMGFFLLNGLFLIRAVLHPLWVLEGQYRRFNQGYDSRAIFNRQVHFTAGEKEALEKIGSQLENHQVIRLSNRQAQYLALQNQINPHFLYNTLEAIRGDALSEGLDNIAAITEALATFFRYTISNMDSLVTLEEELSNAENYFSIQNYRFGDRIRMGVVFQGEIQMARGFMIPKLTLQPIIENAIIHGLEHQVGPGTVTVEIGSDGERLLIAVTDDGVGMEESVLESITRRLANPVSEKEAGEKGRNGGIALVNVDNRIRLLFGEQYGLRLSSIRGFGTRVEITLPVRRDPGEVAP